MGFRIIHGYAMAEDIDEQGNKLYKTSDEKIYRVNEYGSLIHINKKLSKKARKRIENKFGIRK